VNFSELFRWWILIVKWRHRTPWGTSQWDFSQTWWFVDSFEIDKSRDWVETCQKFSSPIHTHVTLSPHPHYPSIHQNNSFLIGLWPCPVNHLSVSTDGESWERPLLTTGSYRVDDHCLSYQTLEVVSQSSRCPTWEIFWLLHLPRDCFVTRNRVCGRTKFKPRISIISLSPADGGGWRKPTRCCLYIYIVLPLLLFFFNVLYCTLFR